MPVVPGRAELGDNGIARVLAHRSRQRPAVVLADGRQAVGRALGNALAQALADLRQDGVLGLGAAGSLGEDLAAAGRGQRVELQVKRLFPSRDPSVIDVQASVVSEPGGQYS